MDGLSTSYIPNFTDPSMRYPIVVGPRPANRACIPSVCVICIADCRRDRLLSELSTCFRVLITSTGVVIA